MNRSQLPWSKKPTNTKKHTQHTKMSDEDVAALVVDNGSGMCKVRANKVSFKGDLGEFH